MYALIDRAAPSDGCERLIEWKVVLNDWLEVVRLSSDAVDAFTNWRWRSHSLAVPAPTRCVSCAVVFRSQIAENGMRVWRWEKSHFLLIKLRWTKSGGLVVAAVAVAVAVAVVK